MPACGVPSPDGPTDSFGVDFSPSAGAAARDVRGAIVFVVDGVNASVFREMLKQGELPAIQRYFVARGLYAPKAVANTPSVTLANLTTLVTGRFPGHHGIVGINWFDRRSRLLRNYDTIAQKNTLDGDYKSTTNIYEQFPDEMTVSIFFQPHRGTTKFFENWLSAGPPFFFGWYEYIDRLTLHRFGEMMDLARAAGRFPVITYAYLLAPDFQAYAHGVSSSQYRTALRHTDRQIGRLLGDLKRAGLLENIIIAMVSDHSLGDVKNHFHMDKFLRDTVGLNLATRQLCEETAEKDRRAYYDKYSAVTCGSGDRFWAIYLRKPNRAGGGYEPWSVRPSAENLANYAVRPGGPTVNLPEKLIQQEAVDAIAWATGPNRCRVRMKTGEVEFAQPAGPGGEIAYKPIRGTDPLGYRLRAGDRPMTISQSPRQWLELTHNTQYPNLPAQIVAYFRSARAGDIAVFASPGWDFFTRNRAGHGGIRAYDDLLVPLLIAGPGVPHETRKVAQTADLVPTLLTLLGKPLPPNLDGETLIPAKIKSGK